MSRTAPGIARSCALALLLAATAGCSLMRDGIGERWGGTGQPIPEQPRVVADPVVEHRFVLTDPDQTVFGEVQVIEAREEDTFSDIARSFGLGYDELVNANPGIDPWLPGAGTEIILPTRFVLPEAPREGIVLNIAAKRLFYFEPASDADPATMITYPIGIGRVGWATPTGQATVIARATDPAWYVPRSVRAEHAAAGDPLPSVVPPGPDNPLGRHVLKLDMPGYLLHGTNQPYGVGMRVSHGCVRLYPENIESLYASAGLGTPVTIVNQPVLAGWREEQFYVAAYPRLEDDERDQQVLIDEVLAAIRDRHWMLRDEQGAAALLALIGDGDGIARRFDSAARSPNPSMVYVDNVTEPPADGPDREEVVALLDEMMREVADAEADLAGGDE